MAIEWQVLGGPGRDNAVLARIVTGQAVHRLLFDCGEGCLAGLPLSEIRSIDHLFFSHFHMDHVAGFDAFFRATFNRPDQPTHVWGPPGSNRIMHHRFRGFLWNLSADQPGEWYVHDLCGERVDSYRYATREAFAQAHPAGSRNLEGGILNEPAYTVEALQLQHLSPSMAYIIREKPRVNIDTSRLAALGLRPGPWLAEVKERRPGQPIELAIDGIGYELRQLQDTLLRETPGSSLAYLTDFLLDESTLAQLRERLRGVGTMICESQYRHADVDLARRHYHLTARQAAELARDAGVGRLVLFHLSSRYRPTEWLEMLDEARSIFPDTSFPPGWDALLGDDAGHAQR